MLCVGMERSTIEICLWCIMKNNKNASTYPPCENLILFSSGIINLNCYIPANTGMHYPLTKHSRFFHTLIRCTAQCLHN